MRIIFPARAKSTSSMVWKSILEARDLIDKGARWRVSNGKNIKIWEHRWLPTPASFKVQSPISIHQGNATVQELLKFCPIEGGKYGMRSKDILFSGQRKLKLCLISPLVRPAERISSFGVLIKKAFFHSRCILLSTWTKDYNQGCPVKCKGGN